MWRGTALEVVGDNHSPAPINVWQWDIVVLDRHLVLLVFAVLGIRLAICVYRHMVVCVGYMCVCGT